MSAFDVAGTGVDPMQTKTQSGMYCMWELAAGSLQASDLWARQFACLMISVATATC